MSLRPTKAPTSVTMRVLKTGLTTIGVVGTLLGILTGVLYFLPNVAVADTPALNPKNPFSTPFFVTNSGNIPISALGVSCWLNQVSWSNGGYMENDFIGQPQHFVDMEPGDQEAVPCYTGLENRNDVVHADIRIIAFITPEFAPSWCCRWISKVRTFRFVTQRASDGTFRWLPAPETKKTKNKAFPPFGY